MYSPFLETFLHHVCFINLDYFKMLHLNWLWVPIEFPLSSLWSQRAGFSVPTFSPVRRLPQISWYRPSSLNVTKQNHFRFLNLIICPWKLQSERPRHAFWVLSLRVSADCLLSAVTLVFSIIYWELFQTHWAHLQVFPDQRENRKGKEKFQGCCGK